MEENKQIKVKCYTNLDYYSQESWPEYFSCRPEKGDLVQSESGKILKICGITHCQQKKPGIEASLKIELHKSF